MSQYQASPSHSFDVKIAAQLGSVELAILVNHFLYWISHNQRLGRNFIDGRTWMYQTREEIAAHFPYFSQDQIRRFTDKLVKLKILRKGNYNKHGMDKTIWYAFENEEMFTIGENAKSIDESANRSDENAKAIPKSKPKSKATDIIDLGLETAAPKKNKVKTEVSTADPKRRWRLTKEECQTFEFLQDKGIDANESKLAYWAKHYSYQRLVDVYSEAKSYNPESMRKYMSFLLEKNSAVPSANMQKNKDFLSKFLETNPWPGIEIKKDYFLYTRGNYNEDLSFNMDSQSFMAHVWQKYEACFM